MLTFVNGSLARFIGKTPESLIGTSVLPFIFKNDIEIQARAIHRLSTGAPVTSGEIRMYDQDGQIRWVLWTIRALFDDAGNLREYQCVGRDITEQKETTEKHAQYLAQMEYFSRKLEEFAEMPPDADIFAAIGNALTNLLPHAIVDVNSFDPVFRTLRTRAVFGPQAEKLVTRCTENSLPMHAIPVPDTLIQLLASGTLCHLPGKLHFATFELMPVETCEEIENELNLRDFYSIGLTRQGNLLGNILMILPEGETIDNAPFIELYARAASITLKRQILDTALKESERKRMDELLRNSENYLLKIFNSTQSGLAIIDPDTHTIFDINSTALEMIGCEKNAVIGAPCRRVFCTAETGACPVTDLNREITRSECIMRTADGTKKPVLKTVVPVPVNGRLYLLESFLDISKQKNAETALREDGDRFRNLVEKLPQNVWECDLSGKLTFVNNSGLAMYGFAKEDLQKNLLIWQTIHEKDRDRVVGNFRTALMHKPSDFPVSHTYTALRKDGSTFDTIVYHVPVIHDGKIAGMRGIGIDLSATGGIG